MDKTLRIRCVCVLLRGHRREEGDGGREGGGGRERVKE